MIEQAKLLKGCDIVIIQGSENDWQKNVEITGSGNATFINAFNEVLKITRENNPNAKIIAVTPSIRIRMNSDSTSSTPNKIGKNLFDYTKELEVIYKKEKIPYVDCMQSNFWGVSDQDAFKLYLKDGVHPNEEGHAILASNLKQL